LSSRLLGAAGISIADTIDRLDLVKVSVDGPEFSANALDVTYNDDVVDGNLILADEVPERRRGVDPARVRLNETAAKRFAHAPAERG